MRRPSYLIHFHLSVLCGLSLGVCRAAPPSFYVRHWSSEDGLPAGQITALAQTREGYLWVGTWFGLARFDGTRFVVFNLANTPELPYEAISALAVDKVDGALWIGTTRGLLRYRGGHFERLSPSDRMERWDISELVAPARGGVWVRSDHKVAWRSSSSENWSLLQPLPEGERPKGMWESDDGVLEVMTSRRICRVDCDGSITGLTEKWATNDVLTGGAPRDRRGNSWVATGRELRRLTNGKWTTLRLLPDRRFPMDWFWEDRSGAMWVAHNEDGLWRYSERGPQKIELGARDAGQAVGCLFEDREGHIWAGTARGLFQLRPRLFRTYSAEDGLPHAECWSVAPHPDGSVWVETEKGLARIEGEYVRVFEDEPSRNPVKSVLADDEGRLWMGNMHNGVTCWRPGLETNRFWLSRRSGPSGVSLNALYLDRARRVWAGTSHGAMWFENGHPAATFGAHDLPTDEIRAIHQAQDGTFWFGTSKKGVIRWRGVTGETASDSVSNVMRFTKADGLADDRVFCFHEDGQGAVWIGTHGGLSRWKNGKFFTFRQPQGFYHDVVNWMEPDQFGRLWFSCNRGIFAMDRRELDAVADGGKPTAMATVYGTADGMLSPETNGEQSPAGCRTRDGRLWFPSTDGVVVVDPRDAHKSEAPPVVVIEQVSVDGEVIFEDGRWLGNFGSRRPAGRYRDLQIRYTANSFLDPRRTRFQSRMVHHDADWREETQERLAVYTNLRPGGYRFEVRAVNAHGVWSEMPAVFEFSIEPHFWQTWAFYVLCGIGAVGLAVGFTAYRLRWQHRLLSVRHQQALAEERARIARDLHDDLGTALTGVALELDVARRQAPDGIATRLMETASRARRLAERMREVVWAVNPRCDTVSSLASFLEQQAGTLMSGGGIRGRFDFPENIPDLPLDSDTRHQLALGVREALSNALRHSQASEVVVSLAVSGETLTVRVADNGVGFVVELTAGDVGHGLHNLRLRLERIGGKCLVESSPGRGTRVEFRVPLLRPQRKEGPP
jgi:signal transduction histidine kinase/ligand-binding sensor domain-containing protein